MVKTFVLRTHCLLRTSFATMRFDSDNEIVIPEPVLQDLSIISKDYLSEKGVLAREVLDYLDTFNTKELFSAKGAKQNNGSIIRVVDGFRDVELAPIETIDSNTSNSSRKGKKSNQTVPKDQSVLDYRCLQIALGLMQKEKKKVVLISQNPLMRMRAKKLGIDAESFKDELFPILKDQYSGRAIGITSLHNIQNFIEKGSINPKILHNYKDIVFYPNMFIVFQDVEKTLPIDSIYSSIIGRFDGKSIVKLAHKDYHPFKTTEKTVGQIMLKEALMQPASKAPVVIVKGNAGTGKTFEALAVAIDQLKEGLYDQIVVTAPTETVGQERIGFLPGGIEAKFDPHIGGIKDNVRILHLSYNKKKNEEIKTAYTTENDDSNLDMKDSASNESGDDSANGQGKKKQRKRNQQHGGNNSNKRPSDAVNGAYFDAEQRKRDGSYLFDDQLIVIQPIGYLRGRTFLRTFFIIDETQNIMPSLIKSIITREGIDSKFVFLGDPTQIDNPELNERYNGLTFFGEKTKDDEDIWLVTLSEDESVRSKIAKKMAKIL